MIRHKIPTRYGWIPRSSLAAIALCSLISCGQEPRQNRTGTAQQEAGQHSEEFALLTLRDAYGTTTTFTTPAQRIVSFAPNMTEIVGYLGAIDRLAGRTDFCTYPPHVDSIPSIGTLNSYNYERILGLHPDVILMMTFDGSSRSEYDKLKGLGLKPFALEGNSIDGVLNAIDTVGMMLGKAPLARHRTDSLRTIADSLRKMASGQTPVQTFIIIDRSPLITVADGFINEVLQSAGAQNIAAGDPVSYPVYSRELLLHKDPEVILVSSVSENEAVLDDLLALYPEWKELSAVRNHRVYPVPRDIISRPGPRIVDGLSYVYKLLHEPPTP